MKIKNELSNERILEIYYAVYEHFRQKLYNAVEQQYRVVGIHNRVDYEANLRKAFLLQPVCTSELKCKIFFIYAMICGKKHFQNIVSRHLSSLAGEFPLFFDENVLNSEETFEEDYIKIKNMCGSVKESLISYDSRRPKILDLLYRNELRLVTFIILDKMINIIKRIDDTSRQDTLWNKEKVKIQKLASFFQEIDTKIYKQIIDKVNQN